ncbi:pyridoxine/pyridoxamine 5'-phosphate oxidase [Microbacterium sp.]|uniref:pyridoxine/pyridoxamine 5'-phosphate oxidase n=1 Tax=Microbacterium sp. TaxID=51671 RepID=UPI003F9D4CF0
MSAGTTTVESTIQRGLAPEDPLELLRTWVPTNEDPDRPLATLATIDMNGLPDARTVLLSAVNDDGIAIHTDGGSRKARQLRLKPVAALVVHWPDLARQAVLRGRVHELSPIDAADGFALRSRYLKVLANINTDELAQRSFAERRDAFAAFDAEHREPPRPPSWTGFLLVPSEIDFWEGSERLPSRRARYQRGIDRWRHDYVAG